MTSLALLSAASFAASHVVSKRGLRGTSVTAGFMVIVASGWLLVTVPLLFDPPAFTPAKSVALFAASGLFAPAIARAAALAGVNALGPSITVPIQQGLRPVIVLPLAALVLGETFGLVRVLGVAAIVAGGWSLSRDKAIASSDGALDALLTAKAPAPQGFPPSVIRRKTSAVVQGFRPGAIYPVVAACAYATSDLLVKIGLEASTETSYGAPVSIGTGLVVWTLAHAFPSVRKHFKLGRGAGWLVLSGACMGAAILFLFHALDRADVSLVAPVIATQPLFVFLLSAVLLRHLERRDRSTILAGLVVVGGTILVSL